MKVLGLCGSLRKDSYNRKALKIAIQIVKDLGHEIIDPDANLVLPLYNKDIQDRGFPPEVKKLRDLVISADVILIGAAEYNYSVSGVLKNALDWLSREGNVMKSKVVAMFGASTGMIGTARGQLHLRQIFVELETWALPKPQIFIREADTAFDELGNLKNPKTVENLKKLLEGTFALAAQLKK